VALENIPPAAVAQRGRALGRAHDVGEQDGREHPIDGPMGQVACQEALDLVEQGVLVARAEEMVAARKLDRPRIRDSAGDPVRKVRRVYPIAFAAEDRGRCRDAGQQRTDIQMQIHAEERLDTARAQA
jgi:hypothetical protein